jgi:hypothetical protein
MSVMRHWFAWNADGETVILLNEQAADDYRSTGGQVRGPFVTDADYRGAVDALNAMIAAEERLLSGDDGVDALDGLRLALKQARTVVGGR